MLTVSSHLAVPGAHLQLRRHHGPDARGGAQVWHRGLILARHHDGDGEGHQLPGGHRPEQHAGPPEGGQHSAGGDPEGPQRLPGEEATVLPQVGASAVMISVFVEQPHHHWIC